MCRTGIPDQIVYDLIAMQLRTIGHLGSACDHVGCFEGKEFVPDPVASDNEDESSFQYEFALPSGTTGWTYLVYSVDKADTNCCELPKAHTDEVVIALAASKRMGEAPKNVLYGVYYNSRHAENLKAEAFPFNRIEVSKSAQVNGALVEAALVAVNDYRVCLRHGTR
jgi:hypothetical protein